MIITSKILRSPHAFSTRLGGVSFLEHTKTMNLAFGRGDDDQTVLQNLEIFAKEVGFDPHNVISLPQIHSDTVYEVGKSDAGQGFYIRENIREGDGYITEQKGITLGVKTADCVPILFEAERGGEIAAVGAVHAGWRGTVLGIAVKCAGMLCQNYGVLPSQIRAAIGPCIHKCCYEVGEDIRMAVEDKLGISYAEAYVTPKKNSDRKYLCDLAEINKCLLSDFGVLRENIDVINECTCCNPKLFFSHRYSEGIRGTMLNVIFLR